MRAGSWEITTVAKTHHAAAGPLVVNPDKPMSSDVTAEEIRKVLKLEPNQTCGYVRETYKSALAIAPGGVPAPSRRDARSARCSSSW
jgi:hypothetical protein